MNIDDVCAPEQAQLLRSLLKKKLIHFRQGPISKKKAFQLIATSLADDIGSDEDQVEELEGDILNALIARERLGSTALGQGVAIPHARLEMLSTPRICVFKTQGDEIDYSEGENTPVSLLFALLVPEQDDGQALKIYAALATCLDNAEFAKQLHHVENAQQVLDIFG